MKNAVYYYLVGRGWNNPKPEVWVEPAATRDSRMPGELTIYQAFEKQLRADLALPHQSSIDGQPIAAYAKYPD